MRNIVNVKVYLENNPPKTLIGSGILRIGGADVFYDDGSEEQVSDLDYGAEFHSVEQLKEYVAEKLKVAINIINVI